MHDDDGMCGGDDRCAEGFAGVDEHLVHEAGGDQDVPLDLAADVEEQNHKAFHLGVEVWVRADVGVPVAGSLGRAGAFLQFAGEGAFPQ